MPSRSNPRLRIAAFAAIVILLLGVAGLLRPVTDPLVWLLAKAAAPGYAAGARITSAFSRLSAADQRDRDSLAADVVALRLENAGLRELAVENEALKAALAFRERDSGTMVAARVVSETDDDIFHGLVIDRGTEDGVAAGQAVVVGDGIIVGKVAEARRRTATVLLLSDSKSRLAVTVQNAAETVGVLAGDRGLSMSIDLIPQSETVTAGDVVITSGIEPGIRRGLVVGTIDKVSTRTQDPFQTAAVAPFPAAIRPVFVQVIGSGSGE